MNEIHTQRHCSFLDKGYEEKVKYLPLVKLRLIWV
jgi:hypothetical protein